MILNNLVILTLRMLLMFHLTWVAEKHRFAGQALVLSGVLGSDHVGWALMAELDVLTKLYIRLGAIYVLI